MKISEEIISERNQIIGTFSTPMQYTSLLAMDITDHRCQLDNVYKNLLREACVIDDCCRRFKLTFQMS